MLQHLHVFIQETKTVGYRAQARSLPFVSILINCGEDSWQSLHSGEKLVVSPVPCRVFLFAPEGVGSVWCYLYSHVWHEHLEAQV